jgi:hypothetical protein
MLRDLNFDIVLGEAVHLRRRLALPTPSCISEKPMNDRSEHNKLTSDCTFPPDHPLPPDQLGRYSPERDCYAGALRATSPESFFNRSRLNFCGRESILRTATSLFGLDFFSNDFHNPRVKGR